jgi:hypothetical protein
MIREEITKLLNVIVIDLGVGIVGSAISVSWLRTTQGSWPDKDTITGVVKIWLGVAAFGIVSYLFIRYA